MKFCGRKILCREIRYNDVFPSQTIERMDDRIRVGVLYVSFCQFNWIYFNPILLQYKGFTKEVNGSFYGALYRTYNLYREAIGLKNLTFIRVTDNDVGQAAANGSYDGLIGMMQRKEVDTGAFPVMTDDLPFDPIIIGATSHAKEGVIATFLEPPETSSQTILSSFMSIDIITWIYLNIMVHVVLSIASFIHCCESEKQLNLSNVFTTGFKKRWFHRYIRNWGKTLRHLLDQISHESESVRLRIIFAITLFSTFVLMNAFKNMIKTDMIASTDRPTLDSLEDLVSPQFEKYKPALLSKVSMLNTFKFAPVDSVYAKVWQKIQRIGESKCVWDVSAEDMTDLQRAFGKFVKDPFFAAITDHFFMRLGRRNVCQATNSKYKHHISNKKFAQSSFAFGHSKFFHKTMRRYFDKKLTKLFESGTYFHTLLAGADDFVEPTVSNMICTGEITEFRTGPDSLFFPLSFQQFYSTVIMCISFYGSAALILLFESMSRFIIKEMADGFGRKKVPQRLFVKRKPIHGARLQTIREEIKMEDSVSTPSHERECRKVIRIVCDCNRNPENDLK